MEQASTIDWPTTIFVTFALITAGAATYCAWKFARTVGGDMGAAFRWVQIGVIVFAVSRADDFFKVSSLYTQLGVDYDKVMMLPHHIFTFAAWVLIAIGFYKMDKAFA
jgi:hypothetical protein